MARVIDADKFLKVLMTPNGNDQYMDDCGLGTARAISLLNKQPTADAKEIVRGEWVNAGNHKAPQYLWECSICKAQTYDISNWSFCPNCGADMRGEKDG